MSSTDAIARLRMVGCRPLGGSGRISRSGERAASHVFETPPASVRTDRFDTRSRGFVCWASVRRHSDESTRRDRAASRISEIRPNKSGRTDETRSRGFATLGGPSDEVRTDRMETRSRGFAFFDGPSVVDGRPAPPGVGRFVLASGHIDAAPAVPAGAVAPAHRSPSSPRVLPRPSRNSCLHEVPRVRVRPPSPRRSNRPTRCGRSSRCSGTTLV